MNPMEDMPRWKQLYRNLVHLLLRECEVFYGERLVSFCVFGSVGRGTMHHGSDIDFLIVAEPLPMGRVARVREFSAVEGRLAATLARNRGEGVHTELSPVFKTPEEVRMGSLLFLDMLEDGRILFDRNDFLKGEFAAFRKRLERLGARRIRKGDAWYWILKDQFTPGEEFSL